MSSDRTIGAFFPCYKNRAATEFVVKNFRSSFPDSPLFLLSDHGDDFSDIAEKYKCHFEMSPYWLGGTGPESYYGSQKLSLAWDRHKKAVEHCKTDYLIVLEDDVWVKKPFKISDDFDINGTRWGRMDGFLLQEIQKSGGKIPRDGSYGICGGGIYNCRVFLNIFDDVMRDIAKNHEKISAVSPQVSCMDCNLVFHFCKRGYSYSFSEWLVTIPQDCNALNGDNYVVHGYKELYVK